MSVAPGDPCLNLTPQETRGWFNLFRCCLPKEEEFEKEEQQQEEQDNTRDFDLPEVVEEDLATDEKPAPVQTANTVFLAFFQMLFAIWAFNFNHKSRPTAITAEPTTEKHELEKVHISEATDVGVEIEDIPEIATVE